MSNSNGTRARVSGAAIVQSVKQLEAAVVAWQTDDMAKLIQWRGVERRVVSQTVEQAAVALFDLVDTLDIDEASRPLVLTIDRFDDAFTTWAEKCATTPDQIDPAGDPAVWNTYQEVLDAVKPRSFPRPEPIPALLNQKVPYRHIAKIYGWFDEAGSPDTTKVQEEITTPGTHYDPKTWKSKSQIRFEEEIVAKWAEREFRLDKRRTYREITAPHPKEKKPCPESIEDLLRAGVNATQIAKMHKTTVAEVRHVAETLGLPLAGNAFGSAFLTRDARKDEEDEISRQAEQMRIDGLNAHPELGDDSAGRIAAMAADGVPNGDISRALAAAFPGMTIQHVTAALKQRNKRERAPA